MNKLDKQLWRQLPETQDLLKVLEEDVQNISEAWIDGAYTDTSAEGTAQKNSEALGKVRAIVDIIDWIRSNPEGEDDND